MSGGPPAGDRGAAAERTAGAWDAVFAADLHLRPSDPAGLARARAMIEACRHHGSRLILLGDVFDQWVGPTTLELEEYSPLFETLRSAAASGARIDFLPGNRDFLLTAEDGRALGLSVRDEEWRLDVGGRRLCLLHGDQLLTRDRRYQAYKWCVRSWPFIALARRLPRRLCFFLARRLRRIGRRSLAAKTPEELGLVDREVLARLESADAVLCGHVHRAIRRRWDAAGELLVLPPFCDEGEFLVLRDGDFVRVGVDGRESSFPAEPVVPAPASLDPA